VAAGSCPGRRRCWKGKKRGYVYDNPRAPGGLSHLRLRAGAAGRSRFDAIGAGTNLFLPAMPIPTDADVVVELKRTDQDGIGICWAADHTRVKKNSADLFVATGQ